MIPSHILDALKKLKRDPVLFAEVLLNFHPFPYQAELLRDESKRIVACWGRQTGKSTTVAVKAVHRAFCNEEQTILIASPSHRQSLLMYNRVRRLLSRSTILRRSVVRMSRDSLTLANRSSITALPMAEERLRGYTAHMVIVDEAAFTPSRVIVEVLMPMLAATDGTLMLVGTPWGKDHIFYRAFTSGEWSVHHVRSSQCPLISREFLERQRRLMTVEEYMREYDAEFVESRACYFPQDLITRCVNPALKLMVTRSELGAGVGGEYYGGLDLGKLRDYSVLAVVERVGGKLVLRLLRIFGLGTPYSRVIEEVADTCKRLRLRRLAVDRSGVGEAVYEELRARIGVVDGVRFTAERKAEMLTHLKMLMEQGRLEIPCHKTLINQLHNIQYRTGWAGTPIFTHPKGKHDDAAIALALACWAAKTGAVAARAW